MPNGIEPHIRVVSRRKGGTQARPDETVLDIDRSNPVLGNRHVLHDHRNPAERERVIAAYRTDLDLDWKQCGPMSVAIREIAARVRSGESIALRCWCAPEPCHGDHLVAYIHRALCRL